MVQCLIGICEDIMYIEDFSSVVTRLYDDKDFQNSYMTRIREVDLYLTDGIIENKYVESVLKQNDYLIQTLFGELSDHVYWFLYDWKPGNKIKYNDVDYVINNVTDFITCTQQIHNLPMKPKTFSGDDND